MLSSEFDGSAEIANYSSLYKVYSIWICFNVPDYLADTVSRYHIVEENVIGKVFTLERDYNLMESVIIRLGKNNLTPNRLLKLLHVIFGNEEDSVR